MTQSETLRLLRLPQVTEKTGLSRSQIYALIASGGFPQQVKLGQRSVCWVEHEIDDWIARRMSQRVLESQA